MAFVLVPHLEPTHKGMMPELLGRHTKMKVVEAEDGMEVQPNCVYVIPPNADLAILHGRLQVLEPAAPRGLRTPIDFFFRHLAADQKEKAIGIILSGMGSDGTLGLRAIKEQLGMVMVQDPASAKYDGMPRSAIGTGMADYVASAEELPAKLIQYTSHLPAAAAEACPGRGRTFQRAAKRCSCCLRAHSGNDFSCYKKSTINRRIERRMGVHQFNSLPRYVRFLQENPQEVELLYKELLIGVTGFFRDPGLFDFLKEKAIPQLLQDRPARGPLRVWNPGLLDGRGDLLAGHRAQGVPGGPEASGESEHPDFRHGHRPGSHRQGPPGDFPGGHCRGRFPGAAAAVLRPGRRGLPDQEGGPRSGGLRAAEHAGRSAVHEDGHPLLPQPLDLLERRDAEEALAADALRLEPRRPAGPGHRGERRRLRPPVLAAGREVEGLPADGGGRAAWHRNACVRVAPRAPPQRQSRKAKEPDMDILYAAQRALLDFYGPPAVIVNSEGDIVYVNARTGKYLEPASGKVNMNVFAMAREGLREELGVALHNAATRRAAVHGQGRQGQVQRRLDDHQPHRPAAGRAGCPAGLAAGGVRGDGRASSPTQRPRRSRRRRTRSRRNELEEELRRTRERLQTTIQEMQAAQEELRSANEELQSNNEELQSTNEELNSSKEELQSLNEEMQTVNAELQTKMEELSQSNSDMKNLLNGIEIATIFLDNDLGVKRFTPRGRQDRQPGRQRRGASAGPLRHEVEIRPAGRGCQGGARHAGAQGGASRGQATAAGTTCGSCPTAPRTMPSTAW